MLVAYLDPGSGSVIATFLVAGVASVGVALRTMRARVGGVFTRNKKGTPEVDAADVES